MLHQRVLATFLPKISWRKIIKINISNEWGIWKNQKDLLIKILHNGKFILSF